MFQEYYPGGGWTDFVDSFETIDEAKQMALREPRLLEQFQIVDSTDGKIVAEMGRVIDMPRDTSQPLR